MSEPRGSGPGSAAPRIDVSYEDALRCFERRAQPRAGLETVPLGRAHGRVLGQDIGALRDVPAFDNAALDGVAFPWLPHLSAGGRLALCCGRSAAGHGFSERVQPGQAVRILTGAPLPPGTDTVIPIEACTILGDQVELPPGVMAGANRRRRGEDIAAGSRVLASGTRLGSWQIAAAAALGLGELVVHRCLRVALFSTGDELLAPGANWREAGVFDANRPLLAAMLAGLPVEVEDHGILPDDRDQIRAMLEQCQACDLVLSSGGASHGDEDHVASLLAERGALDFWRVAMRPGRPLALGAMGDTVYVALPGNPVAAALSFLRFVRPLLMARAGAGWHLPAGRRLPADFTMTKKQGRTELLRGRAERTEKGEHLQRLARQGSGLVSTLLEADGIIEIDAARAQIVPGDPLTFLSWQDLGAN